MKNRISGENAGIILPQLCYNPFMSFNIQEELKKLPAEPGVYLMHDADGRILYVGKASSLKNRVKSYFAKTVNRGPKIIKMIGEIAWFETITVSSETEAQARQPNRPAV